MSLFVHIAIYCNIILPVCVSFALAILYIIDIMSIYVSELIVGYIR